MNKVIERYDPSKPVCDNQADFNVAVKEAINQYTDKGQSLTFAYFIFGLIIIIWSISLALKSTDQRLIHIVLGLAFAPVYIIAYYLNRFMN